MEALVIVRPAQVDEIPFLQARLAESDKYEQVDLSKAIVFVAEDDGLPCGMVAARLIWQVEPLMLFRDFERVAPPFAKKRAAYKLGRAIIGWIGDRTRNTTKLHSFFAYICDKGIALQVKRFGFIPIYRKGKFWGRDL